MAQRFNRGCRMCGTLTREPNGFCEKHQANANDVRNLHNKQRMENDPVWKLYGYRWELYKRALRAQGNLQCQRLVGGIQCLQMVDIFHHLFSPRVRPDLMYESSNVVGVCREHHPTTEGSPEWVLNKDYVPTIMTPMVTYIRSDQ